jgi:hypothetical protein
VHVNRARREARLGRVQESRVPGWGGVRWAHALLARVQAQRQVPRVRRSLRAVERHVALTHALPHRLRQSGGGVAAQLLAELLLLPLLSPSHPHHELAGLIDQGVV